MPLRFTPHTRGGVTPLWPRSGPFGSDPVSFLRDAPSALPPLSLLVTLGQTILAIRLPVFTDPFLFLLMVLLTNLQPQHQGVSGFAVFQRIQQMCNRDKRSKSGTASSLLACCKMSRMPSTASRRPPKPRTFSAASWADCIAKYACLPFSFSSKRDSLCALVCAFLSTSSASAALSAASSISS